MDKYDIDVRLLGPARITVAGRPVPLRGSRPLRLFALLALHPNNTVSTERIVDVLWGEPPKSARQQVHNVIAMTRKSLAGTDGFLRLQKSGPGYRLDIDERCVDVVRFRMGLQSAELAESNRDLSKAIQDLAGALSEWNGPALTGLDGDTFANAATTLDEQRLTAYERLSELRLRLGDAETVVKELVPLVGGYPFREVLRAQLMKGLYLTGRQADAIAVYEEGRRLLATEFGLDPGRRLREAHALVLRGEPGPAPEAAPPASRSVSLRPPAMDNAHERDFLPRDIAEFTGRHGELERIRVIAEQAVPHAPTIVAIDGMGGVGKTSLAVHASRLFSADYPDGRYFVDLAGYSSTARPADASQALSTLLRGSGLSPEFVPGSVEEKSALWRSRTSGRRVLVVLDNALDAGHVRPLLPSEPSSLVLITTRRRMTALEGATTISLDVLSEPEAVALFARIAGPERVEAEPDAVSSVIELCGRLPLAIQVAVARLRDRPGWSVSYLVDQLRDRRTRARLLSVGDRKVLDVLTWSHEMLADREQRVFRLMGAHSGSDIDVYSLAALVDLPVHEAGEAAETLCDVNLFEQRSAGRYSMHDLTRDCSRRLLEELDSASVRAAAVQRLVDYYLCSIMTWCDAIHRPPARINPSFAGTPAAVEPVASRSDALAVLEVEYGNIFAATQLAAEAGLNGRAWEITYALTPFFAARNYPVAFEEHLLLGLTSARKEGSPRGEMLCLTALASFNRARSFNERASDLLREAMELSRRIGDRQSEIWQLFEAGSIFYADADLDSARSTFSAGLEIANAEDDRQAQISFINNLGTVTMDLGDLTEARRLLEHALELGSNSSSDRYRIPALINLGQILLFEERFERAVEWFTDLLKVCGGAAVELGEQFARVGLTNALRGTGDLEKALEVCRATLETAETRENVDMVNNAQTSLGYIHLSMGDIATARAVFDQVQGRAERTGLLRHAARAYEGLAHVELASGNLEASRTLWDLVVAAGPAGVDYVESAVRHRSSLGESGVVCWRCADLRRLDWIALGE